MVKNSFSKPQVFVMSFLLSAHDHKYTDCVPLPQHTEALLYGFQSIAETIDVNYSDVIPGLIGLIPRININNVQLADTVMFTIGKKIEGWIITVETNEAEIKCKEQMF